MSKRAAKQRRAPRVRLCEWRVLNCKESKGTPAHEQKSCKAAESTKGAALRMAWAERFGKEEK